jgi:hypothetical protein
MEIKSLAALKRAITVGTKLRVIDHWKSDLLGTTRTIIKTQTNGVYYEIPGNDKWKRLWMPYPVAEHLSFPAPGRFRFDFGDGCFWELEFEEMP